MYSDFNSNYSCTCLVIEQIVCTRSKYTEICTCILHLLLFTLANSPLTLWTCEFQVQGDALMCHSLMISSCFCYQKQALGALVSRVAVHQMYVSD
jgi:hypothetical protein